MKKVSITSKNGKLGETIIHTKKDELNIIINVKMKVIASHLIGAFEGGSNYWYEIKSYVMPKRITFRIDKAHVYEYVDFPMSEGGAVVLTSTEEKKSKEYRLDLPSIRRGIAIMAKKYPKHFADLMVEDGDATTSDVLLQCCVFGDAIYG